MWPLGLGSQLLRDIEHGLASRETAQRQRALNYFPQVHAMMNQETTLYQPDSSENTIPGYQLQF